MLSKIALFCFVVVCGWAIADASLGLEHSWVLYLHRVLAPLSFAFVFLAGLVVFSFKGFRKRCIIFIWALALLTCFAPLARSFYLFPVASGPVATSNARLRVLNFNALGYTDLAAQLIAEIERQQPDIITLQEVNPKLAHALQTKLSLTYPCQQLDPAEGSSGMGILARESCSPVSFSTHDAWVGKPQLVQVSRPGKRPVLVINIHAVHPHAYFKPVMCCSAVTGLTDTVRARETSIDNILAARRTVDASAVIIAGDLNSTMRNTVYEKVRSAGFGDSWLTVRGPISGGTWPSLDVTGSSFLQWLLRIDFVFHCAALRPVSAELLPEYLGSDHRGMIISFGDSVRQPS